jgi:hypothetical protein
MSEVVESSRFKVMLGYSARTSAISGPNSDHSKLVPTIQHHKN